VCTQRQVQQVGDRGADVKVKALIIPVGPEGGTPRIEEIEDDAEGIGSIIGGTPHIIVPVQVVDVPWHGYIDEEGKSKGLFVNVWAGELAYRLGWLTGDVICGTAVFLGNAHGEQYEADVPNRVVTEFVNMIEKEKG
jgi:hypothetical protein